MKSRAWVMNIIVGIYIILDIVNFFSVITLPEKYAFFQVKTKDAILVAIRDAEQLNRRKEIIEVINDIDKTNKHEDN